MTAPALIFRPGSADPWSRRETPLDWQAHAACLNTGPDLMFPEKGDRSPAPKRICGYCPARRECLEYALENDERHGIWGGLTLRERRRLPRPAAPQIARRLAA